MAINAEDGAFITQERTENILTRDATAVEMGLLVAFTALLVWYYRARDVPWFVSACVFLSWLLGFMGTLLLPADIVLTLLNGTHSRWVTRVWYALYWTTFLLAWVIIPTLYQSWKGGELTWRERLRSAVRMNVRQYLLMALIVVLFVIYLVGSGRVNAGNVGGFLMALANTYGLVIIIMLLGHGLVQVPRKLWETSFNERQLQRHYFVATKVDTDMHDAIFDLEEAERHIDCMEKAMEDENGCSADDRLHLVEILASVRRTEAAFHEEIDKGVFRKRGNRRQSESMSSAEAFRDLGLVTITPRDAARLHADLRAAQVKVVAIRTKWATLVRETETLECLLDKIPWGEAVFEATPGKTRGQYWRAVWKRLQHRCWWIWRAYVRWLCCRTLAMFCAVLSVVILWSEVVAASRWNLSPFGILLQCMYQHEAGIIHAVSMQAAVLVPFLYMSLCCYRSLFTLRIFGSFTLQGGHHSLPGPLLINAQYLVRLQFPLGYNFLRILRYNSVTSSRVMSQQLPAFEMLMREMKTVPVLGTDFNTYAPMLLVVLCMFTFYKGYARILRLVGLEHEDLVSLDDPEEKARVTEGRALLERGKRQAQAVALRSKVEDDDTEPKASPTGQGMGSAAKSVAYSKIEDIPSRPESELEDSEV